MLINSQPLYQLSYRGTPVKPRGILEEPRRQVKAMALEKPEFSVS